MPANRRRTELWRRSLWQVYERNGALEVSLPRPDDDESSNLIWRVRILGLDEESITIEAPGALGQSMPLDPGTELVCVLGIGQNRWMFPTTVQDQVSHRSGPNRTIVALRLEMPTRVERCQRRSFYRVSTHTLSLPKVTCWPLLNPTTAGVAEKANEAQIRAALNGDPVDDSAVMDETIAQPEVGPSFDATLANLGGGGIGLIIEPEDSRAMGRHRMFWLRITLTPEIPLPLAVSAKLVHTHIDSSQRTYAGFAFEFNHNRTHQRFVVEQLQRYVDVQQDNLRRAQSMRKAS
ncbi:MAG: hypothetical protein ACF8PN_06695 [Phycisphaerales bacterium]